MSQSLRRVVIRGTGSFLPNEPITNDRLDDLLGPLSDAPTRVQGFVKNVGPRMLETGGVESRHFAIDPETHKLTHTVATLGEEAARRALDAAGRKPEDVDLLLLSAPIYDYLTPPTSTVLQEKLGIEQCAEMEIHSNCSGVGKCVQIAYDALRTGRYKTALVVYSQHSSVYLRSSYFNQEQMNKNQAALRYILADGSGALFLEAVDADEPNIEREIIGTHLESVGGKMPPAMTSGGGVADLIECKSPPQAIFAHGKHHLDQDFSAVAREAAKRLTTGVVHMLESLDIDPKSIDHFVYSIPNKSLYENNLDHITRPFDAVPDQMKFRAQNTGYAGGASILLHFDEMVRNQEIKPGQLVVLSSVESSKWMCGGFVVRW